MLPNLSFSIAESPVAKRLKVWRHVFKTPEISAPKQASLTAHDHVFALGSCFANEIRAALEQGGITVHPTMDAISATMRAKSILRSCADAMTRSYDNVIYWPSYEFAMWSGNAFCSEDGRHIRPEAVKQITSAFCRAFYSDSIARRIEMATECPSDHGQASGQTPRRKKWRFPFRKAA